MFYTIVLLLSLLFPLLLCKSMVLVFAVDVLIVLKPSYLYLYLSDSLSFILSMLRISRIEPPGFTFYCSVVFHNVYSSINNGVGVGVGVVVVVGGGGCRISYLAQW